MKSLKGTNVLSTEAALGDIDLQLFIKKQDSERNFDPPPLPAQEIQAERPASGYGK